jgi:hypothetical protein
MRRHAANRGELALTHACALIHAPILLWALG